MNTLTFQHETFLLFPQHPPFVDCYVWWVGIIHQIILDRAYFIPKFDESLAEVTGHVVGGPPSMALFINKLSLVNIHFWACAVRVGTGRHGGVPGTRQALLDQQMCLRKRTKFHCTMLTWAVSVHRIWWWSNIFCGKHNCFPVFIDDVLSVKMHILLFFYFTFTFQPQSPFSF